MFSYEINSPLNTDMDYKNEISLLRLVVEVNYLKYLDIFLIPEWADLKQLASHVRATLGMKPKAWWWLVCFCV